MKVFKSLKTKPQAGFISIEMIGVIAVIIFGYALATGKVTALFSGSKTVEEIGNIQQLLTTSASLKGSTGYGTSGTNLVPAIIASGGAPTTMSVVSGALYNAWSGAVTVTSTGTGRQITYNAVPQAECVEIAAKTSRNGIVSTTKIGANTAVTGEVTPVTAGAQCTDPSVIVWTTLN